MLPLLAGLLIAVGAASPASAAVVPAVPSGLVATDNHDGTATLAWNAQSAVTEYHVRYTAAGSSIHLAGTSTRYRTPTLPMGTSVFFRLAAGNGAGFSAIASLPAFTLKPPATGNQLIVGSFSNTTAGYTTQSFIDERNAIPGLRVRRAFAGGVPASISNTEAAGDAAAGVVTFISIKPSYTSVGSDNAAISSFARSLPAGSYLTAWHEPENDMSGGQYVAMFRNFYAVAKAANPAVYIGSTFMTYQWGAGRNVQSGDDWWVGADRTDFLGTDTYMDTWQRDAAGNPKPLSADPDHQRWHAWASTKGKPLLLTESGVGQGFSDAQRAGYYAANETWLQSHGYRMVLPWNGAGTPPTGESWDFWGGAQTWPQTTDAVRGMASRGQVDARLN